MADPEAVDVPPSGGDEDGDDVDDDDESSSSSDEDDWDEEDEEEMMHAMAEQAKEDVRRQLRELKAVYRSIKQRNIEIPERFRIKDSDLKLPQQIYAHIYQKIEKECDEVFRVHEYESAETIIQLDKIRKFYFDPIETPHIVVKDISHELQVHTIRNKKTTIEFENLVANNNAIVEEENRRRMEQVVYTESEVKQELEPIKQVFAHELIGDYEDNFDLYSVETAHNIRHLEKRLAQKYERECAWQELMAKKIPADYIPPEDMEVLAQAKNNTGAYQLQTSESYPGEQISIAERRQRIINIKLSMREQVQKFNKLVIEARDEKPRVVQECHRLEREIRKVHVLLPEEHRRKIPPIFDMEPDETQEGLFDISPSEVEAEEQSLLAAAGLQNIMDDIMEDFYGVKKPEKDIYEDDDRTGSFVPPPAGARAARQAKTVDLEFESVASNRCRKVQFNGQSEAERKRFEVQFYPRLYRQELLFKELLRVINYFHERIKYIHDIRVKLEIESKVKTICLLSMISELEIAKDFDNQEKTIGEILLVQKAESKNAKHHMDKIKKKLVAVNGDMKKCEDELTAINKDVDRAIGEKSRFHDYLWRVFRKKIKLEVDDDTDNEEEQEEEDDEEEENEGDDENGGEEEVNLPLNPENDGRASNAFWPDKSKTRLDIDICPDHLDRAIYDHVLDLRLKRVMVEQEMEKNKKLGEIVSAEYVDIETNYQRYQDRLTEMGEEIRIMQRRRQKKMNDLKLMIILRADQIQCMDIDELSEMDGELLDKLAQSFPGTGNVVIFPKDGAGKLDARAAELLKKGKIELEKFKRGKNMLVRLHEEFRKAENEVKLLKEQVKREMTFKFGQEVDLDKICASVINLTLMRQEMLLEKTKMDNYKERAKINQELLEVKYQLTGKIEDNSKLNRLQAVMLERRRDLEYYIWKNEKSTANDEEGGPGGDVSKDLLPKLTSSCLTPSNSSIYNFDYTKLEKDIENAKKLLDKQNKRITELKGVLTKCRTKAGMPPLLKMSMNADDTIPNFTRTANEMPTLNEYCPQIQIPTSDKCKIPPKKDLYLGERSNPNLGDYDFFAELEIRDMHGNEVRYGESSEDEDRTERSEEAVIATQDKTMTDDSEFDKLGQQFEEDELEIDEDDEEFSPQMPDDDLSNVTEEGKEKKHLTLNPESAMSGSGGGGKSSEGSSEKKRRAKAKRASRKSVLQIAEDAKQVTESDVMNRIHRYSLAVKLADETNEEEMNEDFLHLGGVDSTSQQK